MGRFGRITRATATLVLVTIAVAGGLVPAASAAEPDPSDVVMEFDFSASILDDAKTRTQFGDALNGLAAQVEQQSADLTSSDATVSMIQFATHAVDYSGCVDLTLLDNTANVTKFAQCLRSLAAAYRKGRDPALTAKIGVDTNYVEAMKQWSATRGKERGVAYAEGFRQHLGHSYPQDNLLASVLGTV